MYFNSPLCKPKRASLLVSFLLTILLLFGTAIPAFCEVNAPPMESHYSTEVVHHHQGSSAGDGCYTTPIRHNHNGSCYSLSLVRRECNGNISWNGPFDPGPNEYYVGTCMICGARYDQGNTGNKTGQCNVMRDVTENILICPKAQGQIEGYTLGCGHEDGETVGTFCADLDTVQWTNQVTVSLSMEPSTLLSSSDPYLIDESPVLGSTYTITSNGTYTFGAQTLEDTDCDNLFIDIKNIDVTAPTVSISYDSTTKQQEIIVTTQAQDLQPDGSEGSGLGTEPYSYDNGETWTGDSTHTYTENGTYQIIVKDDLGNTVIKEITIDNIEIPSPPSVIENSDNNSNNQDTTSNENPDEDDLNAYVDNIPLDNSSNSEIATPAEDAHEKAVVTPSSNKNTQRIDVPKEMITTPKITPTIKKKENKIATTQPKAALEPTLPTVVDAADKDTSIEDIFVWILLGVLSAILLFLLLFLLYRCSAIYNYVGDNRYRFKGIAFIGSSDGIYSLSLSKSIIDSCDTGLINIKPSLLFCFLHKDDDISIYTLANKEHALRRLFCDMTDSDSIKTTDGAKDNMAYITKVARTITFKLKTS